MSTKAVAHYMPFQQTMRLLQIVLEDDPVAGYHQREERGCSLGGPEGGNTAKRRVMRLWLVYERCEWRCLEWDCAGGHGSAGLLLLLHYCFVSGFYCDCETEFGGVLWLLARFFLVA